MKLKLQGAAAWLPLLVVSFALSACGGGGSDPPPAPAAGGGGGGGGGPAPPPPPPPSVPPPSALSYTSPQTYNVGTAITALTPTVTGNVTTYSVTPALPAGLSLDTTTGSISGTPTAPSRATHTITATNAGGNTTFALEISVLIERSTSDRDDEQPGNQVHVMYVLPSDGADQQLDQTGTLEASLRIANEWFATQTGGKKLRFDTYENGKLDVTFLQLARTDLQMNPDGGSTRLEIEYQLLLNGFDDADKAYLVYYGGDGEGCGRGAWPPTLPGNVAALYVGAAAACTDAPFATGAGPPGYLEFLAVHETLHVLGFAAACAPNHTTIGHVNDSAEDLMFSGGTWRPSMLDVNHDDYFGPTGIPGCRDLANSSFLETLPAGAEAPPGWPYETLTDLGCNPEPTPGPLGVDTQIMFANEYLLNGAPAEAQIFEVVPNPDPVDALVDPYVRRHRRNVQPNDGIELNNGSAVVAGTPQPWQVKENAVFVVLVGAGNCVNALRATATPSRFVIAN
jgi:hypothetical protein